MATTTGTKQEGTAAEQTVIHLMNRQIANWNIMFVKLHNYHWFVKGREFFTLHAKFEELYNEAAQYIDDLAERVLTIGGKPPATMKAYVEEASVSEAADQLSATDMAKSIMEDFRQLAGELLWGMEAADQAGDEATFDMLLSIRSNLEKHSWMLSAFVE